MIAVWYLIRLAVLGLLGGLVWRPYDPLGPTLLIGAATAWVAVRTAQSHGAIRGAALGLMLMVAWSWAYLHVVQRIAGFNADRWILLAIMLLLDAVAVASAFVERRSAEALK